MTNREVIQRALQFHQAGDLANAKSLYEQVLSEEPANAEALHLLGVVAIQSNQPADAVQLIEQAVAIRSDQAPWFGNLGTAKSAVGDFAGSITAYERALELKPTHVESHYNVAHAYRQAGNREAAEASYRTAIQLAPNHTGALNNLATCLRDVGRSDEAVGLLEKVVKTAPDFAQGWYNLANALRDLDRIDDAITACERALELMPDSADIRVSLGMLLLSIGDFERGLPLYELREHASGGALPAECQPRWDGSPLHGRTIMLFAEQGLGDTLQFVRYAGVLKKQGATVFLRCQKPLIKILASYEPIDEIFAEGATLPPFDVAAPLLSLPHLLGTQLGDIPRGCPYLRTDDTLQEHWRRELSHIDGFRIGIAWQGAPGHLSDVRRSLPLAQFEQIANLDGVNLIALQKGFGIEQIDDVPFSVHRLPDDVDEANGAFMDTAAVMMNLDLVITTDTSIAHLAGALGVPVWIALSQGADWRWMARRDDSPWYPSATLYRQAEFGGWNEPFERMSSDLFALVQRDSTVSIQVEVSAGELLDKITILQIKSERITDEAKLENIHRELQSLEQTRDESIQTSAKLTELIRGLRSINEALWTIEDDIRECERNQDFGETFIQLARAVYVTNDRRSEVKRMINELLGSRLVEEKSYSNYTENGDDESD